LCTPDISKKIIMTHQQQLGTCQEPAERTVLQRVQQLLEEGKPKEALNFLRSSGTATTPHLGNALGVCLLRLGDAEQAIQVYRGLLFADGGLSLSRSAPTTFKANFATAMLMKNNVSGCLDVLSETEEKQHPAVQQLRAAIRRWRKGLTFGQKIKSFLGIAHDNPVPLDFPPGYLDRPTSSESGLGR
jgi:hypothetical protein